MTPLPSSSFSPSLVEVCSLPQTLFEGRFYLSCNPLKADLEKKDLSVGSLSGSILGCTSEGTEKMGEGREDKPLEGALNE